MKRLLNWIGLSSSSSSLGEVLMQSVCLILLVVLVLLSQALSVLYWTLLILITPLPCLNSRVRKLADSLNKSKLLKSLK